MTRNFTFVGTNAYWLPCLDSDVDIQKTLSEFYQRREDLGVQRCEQLACHASSFFNPFFQIDVITVPDTGSWLLLIKNGNLTVNTASNGIQRLDSIIKFAEEYNIYVYVSLTNNWFPSVNAPPSPEADSCALPRNYLSNNYGQYLILG